MKALGTGIIEQVHWTDIEILPLDRVNQSRQFRAERSHDCGGLRTAGATRWSTSRSRTMLDLLLRLLFSKHAIDQVGTRSGLIAATGDGCDKGDSAHIGCDVSPTTARHSTPQHATVVPEHSLSRGGFVVGTSPS